MKSVAEIASPVDFPNKLDAIGAILLIEPSIEFAQEVGRKYSQFIDIVIAESSDKGKKLTVCQIEFAVVKICVL